MEERNAERPPLNVEGELVALGPLQRDLIPTYHRWHNDVATARTYVLRQPTTLKQEEARYAALTADSRNALFTIYERAAWRPVGVAHLKGIDHRQRRAVFGVLIGEPDARGRGYGTEVARLVLDYAFTALGLHSVVLTCHEYNLAGRRAYEKAGFRECGRRRQSHWMGGRWWDEVYMDCLAPEFASPVLGRVFVPDAPRP